MNTLPTTSNPTLKDPILTRWKLPPLDTFKLKFDGSVKSNSTAASAIIRNYKWDLIAAKSFNLGSIDFMTAEATGLRNGLILAI